MGKGSRSHRTSNKNKGRRLARGSAILAEPLSGSYPEGVTPSEKELNEQLAREFAASEQSITDNDVMASWDALADEHQSSLELVYGKRGLPEDVKPILDHLGHVIRNKPVAATTKEIAEPPRRVTLFRDTTLDYPELYLEIFVAPDPGAHNDEVNYAAMFARTGSKRAKSVLEADLVVFSGGSDVDPIYYGEARHETTFPSKARDDSDIALYLLCVEHGIPMVGICRGAQFLHVMNGGKLYQDVDGHYGNHSIWDITTKTHIEKISSVHHQMVKDNTKGGMKIIATAARSNKRWSDPKTMESGTHCDIEAFFYRETCCLGFQGHPEYSGYPKYTQWCLQMINEFVILNPDVDWHGENKRINPDLLAQRSSSIIEMAVAKGKKGLN